MGPGHVDCVFFLSFTVIELKSKRERTIDMRLGPNDVILILVESRWRLEITMLCPLNCVELFFIRFQHLCLRLPSVSLTLTEGMGRIAQ